MHNFSDQCLDLARSLLSNNLQHINEDGSVTPAPGEKGRVDEPGHAALAIGEFFRATGEVELGEHDLYDLAARCVTQQAFVEEENDNGIAYASWACFPSAHPKRETPYGNACWTTPANNLTAVFSRNPSMMTTFRSSVSQNQWLASVSV